MAEPRVQIATEGGLRYLVSRPAHPADAERIPVLCFLHGQGEAIPMSIEQSAALHGPLSATSWPDARQRFLVVEPQRPGLRDDWISQLDDVLRIVRRVRDDHGGDPARTYLSGFSLGGNGVLDIAAAGPNLWAAHWAVDPTRLPAAPPRRPMWLSAGPLTKRNAGYPSLAAWEACHPFRVTDESDDHVEAAARAYGRAAVYDWLLAKRLPRPPEGPSAKIR